MMAISDSVYSRSRSASTLCSRTLAGTVLSMSCAVGPVHEQPDDLRVGQERAAVGVVGAHHDSPGILDQQVPFQPDRPLPGVDHARVLVFDRHDAAAGLHLGVAAEPLGLVDLAQVVAQRPVAGHARGLAEEHLADVDGEVGVGR